MTNQPTLAPDLKNGHIVNGCGAANNWMTEIQSVLSIRNEKDERTIYLSQECRAEDVPFSTASLGGGDSIFQQNNILEFLTFAENDDTFQLSTNEITFIDHETNQALAESVGVSQPVEMKIPQSNSRVSCAMRPIKILSCDELLKRLRTGDLAIRDTFMMVSWRDGESSFESYSPCRYINFPDASQSEDYYLQPISGYVLFPREDGFLVAYVACSVNGKNDPIIEFCSRMYRNVFHQFLAMASFEGGSDKPILNLAKTLPIMAAQFDTVTAVKGQCVFYEYA